MSVAGDLVAKAQDWPGAEELSERLKKTIPPQFLDEKERAEAGLGITPEQLQEMQQKLMELETENQELKTDKTLEFKKLELQAYDNETKRIAALNKNFGVEDPSETEEIKRIISGDGGMDFQANYPQQDLSSQFGINAMSPELDPMMQQMDAQSVEGPLYLNEQRQ